MKNVTPAGPKKSGSELRSLLDQIKEITGKSYSQIAIDCGYETKNYFSHTLRREENGTAVPAFVIGKIKTNFARVLSDKVVIEMAEDDTIKNLMQYIVALRTQVGILTAHVAKLEAHCYRSDFEIEHAALKAQMREGVESTARTMLS